VALVRPLWVARGRKLQVDSMMVEMELLDSRLIDEEYEAGIARCSGESVDNITEQDRQAIAGDTPHAGVQMVSGGAANSGGDQGHR
jgi:hypothetical protein